MTHADIAILILLAGVTWAWYDSFRAREAGLKAVRAACAAEGLQLLDDTIALSRLRLRRDERGRLALARVYGFEYSDTGDNRRRGSVHLLGDRVGLMNLGLRLVVSNPPPR